MAEGPLLALASAVVALGAGYSLSRLVGEFIGRMTFLVPLAPTFSLPAVAG